MTNAALIFAGGTGTRMQLTTKPKQFLELNGKPIIIHTLEHFDQHEQIDKIVVVCVKEWIPYLENLLDKFHIRKVVAVVSGGETGQLSIFNGLTALKAHCQDDDIVLIHDGVRPLIDATTITQNIEMVKSKGNAITVKPVIETVVQVDDHAIFNVVERSNCQTAVAPQSFYFKDIYQLHLNAQRELKFDFTDSVSLARYYGTQLYTVMGSPENIKITTPTDFYMFKAIYKLHESRQILG